MREDIGNAVREAMKAGDKKRLSTLRLMSAAIKDRDIAARVDAKGHATGIERVEDREILALLQKMIKQRRESAEIYKTAGRLELAEQEDGEIKIIEEFLPEQMSVEETAEAIKTVINEMGCAGLKDMGRTMAALKERFAGRMDFSKASAVVKASLK